MGNSGLGLLQSPGPGGTSIVHKVLRWDTCLPGKPYSLLAEKDSGPCKKAGVLSTLGGFCLLHLADSCVWT